MKKILELSWNRFRNFVEFQIASILFDYAKKIVSHIFTFDREIVLTAAFFTAVGSILFSFQIK